MVNCWDTDGKPSVGSLTWSPKNPAVAGREFLYPIVMRSGLRELLTFG